MKLRRLIDYVSTNAISQRQLARLGEVMTLRAPSKSLVEDEAVQDMATLSCSDVGAWVSHTSALEFQKERQTWRPEDHLLDLASLTSSSKSVRDDAHRVWARRIKKTIACCTLHSSPQLSVTAFVLPRGTQLDLHDHPGMTVLQVLLHGDMSVLSVDWADSGNARDQHGGRKGIVLQAETMKSGERHVILPSGGGVVHQLSNPEGEASSEYAVFVDFITPPYNTPPGNLSCTYYTLDTTLVSSQGIPKALHGLSKGDEVWLRPNHAFGGPEMEVLLPVSQ